MLKQTVNEMNTSKKKNRNKKIQKNIENIVAYE